MVEETIPHGIYEILAHWDSEAGVWVAESDHVPGLVAEADSPNILAQKLRILPRVVGAERRPDRPNGEISRTVPARRE